MRKKSIAFFLVASLLLGSICGCAYEIPQTDAAKEETVAENKEDTFQEIADDSNPTKAQTTLEKPTATPHILVDRAGYQTGDRKIALFLGEDLPETFWVKDRESGETVYEGSVEPEGYDEETDTYVSSGDFSELTTKGEYYIEAAVIGRSYSFVVEKELYDLAYEEQLQALLGTDVMEEAEDTTQAAAVLSDLLFTYDFYEKEVDEKPANTEKVPAILAYVAKQLEEFITLQDTQSGEIQDISPEENAGLAAVLAQFGALYQKYDRTFSNQCLRSAENAYRGAQKEMEEADAISPLLYYAATQLYKTTGSNTYHIVIKNYMEAQKTVSENRVGQENSDSKWDTYGDVVYLTTSYKVDQEICHELMEELLNDAESLATKAKKDYYLVSAKNGRDTEEILNSMFVLAVVNYVIVSQEYLGILKEDIHFLSGRNLTCASEEYTLSQQSAILFILGDMVEREENAV